MATASSVPAQPARTRRRLRFPATVIVMALAIGLLVAFLPADLFDRGLRRMLIFITGLIAALLLNFWFLFSSRLSWKIRLSAEALLVGALLAFVLSIRSVEFTGDMKPIVHFHWSPSTDELLEAHRAKSAHGATTASISSSNVGWHDFAEYRGRKRDGVVDGPALARDWTKDPPQLIWRQPVGGGYASFSLTDGRAVTIEQRRDREAIVAYDVATGHELWVHDYPALFSERLGGDGPRATPTIADGDVYALGATGVLTKLEFASGKPHWTVNILEQNGSQNIDWGMSGSPLILGDLVIVNPGAQQGTADSRGLVALSRSDGKIVWRHGTAAASYSSPMLARLGDKRQILIFDAGGLAGHDAEGGAELWRFPWTTQFNINVAQPLVFDARRLLITSATGVCLIEVDGSDSSWLPQEVWRSRNLKCSYANPVARQGYVYGLDEGILTCLDVETGKRKWKSGKGRYGHGQMLLTGDLLLILSEQGELVLVEASPEGHHELARLQAIEGKTWNCPILVNGRAYIRNHMEMACYDLRPLSERGVLPAPDVAATPSAATESSAAQPAVGAEKSK